MAPRKSTRHGASASRRRTASTARGSSRGSTRSTRGRRGTRPASVLLIVGLLVLAGWAFYTPVRMHYEESREQARLEAELASLKERNEQLSAQVERLHTPEGVEEVARENLGMVKEGENLYVLVDPAEETSVPPTGGNDEESESVWAGLLDRLFGPR